MSEVKENAETKRKFFIEKARTKKAQEAANKVNAFPEDIPIFYYAGHGVDVCDPFTHKPIIDIVPDDCIYITLTECGEYSYYNEKLENFFFNPSEDARKILRYPYLLDNLSKISKVSGIPMSRFHIHYPGMKYVVSNFIPFAFFHNNTKMSIAVSGLNEKKLMEKAAETYQYKTVTKKDFGFKDTYLASLPKPKLIEVMKKYIVKPEQKDMQERMANGLLEKRIEELFADKEKLTGTDIDLLMEKLFLVFKREDILNLFNGSIFPTRGEVAAILDDRFGDRQYFNEKEIKIIETNILLKINGGKYDLYTSAFLSTTNRSLMHRFPGIHYNIVCRSVNANCLPVATLHRRDSFNRETIRRNVLSSRRPEQKFYHNLSKVKNTSTLESFMTFLEEHKERIESMTEEEKNEFLRDSKEYIDYYYLTDGASVALDILNRLYPLQEKYNIDEIIMNIQKDEKKLQILFPPLFQDFIDTVLTKRFQYYFEHLDKENIESLNESAKRNAYKKIEQSGILKSISNEALKKRIQDFFIQPVKLGKNFVFIIDRINSVIQREYPKAKNQRNALRTKQIALYNNLIAVRKTIEILNDHERKEIIEYLTKNGIISSGNGEPIISKKIKHLIWPDKYGNPFSGGTRKLRKIKQRMTRKK